jgi:hypothetical protein
MDDMFRATKLVYEREVAIAQALINAGISFALSGSNATYLWIASVEEAATRNFRNVEFIIERIDVERVIDVLAGLNLTAALKIEHVLFRHDETHRDRWADQAIIADSLVGSNAIRAPRLNSICYIREMPVLSLPVLVAFQISRWQVDDQVDLRDLIDVGLHDAKWLERLRPEMVGRLEELLNSPDG